MTSQDLIHKEAGPTLGEGVACRVNVNSTERWISAVGGTALVAYGLYRRTPGALALATLGGAGIYRGATGRCELYAALNISTTGEPEGAVKVQRTMTINRSSADLYRYWRDLEHLPRFMEHVEEVEVDDNGVSHWVVRGPLGRMFRWDAEIAEDRPGQRIVWSTRPDSDIRHSGMVEFREASGRSGTEMTVALEYEAPAGGAGALLARFTGEEPSQQLREDLRRFKQLMETGEIATTAGQPTGPR